MYCIIDAFARMNLAQVRGFLLYGTDEYVGEQLPYKDKLKSGSDLIYARLKSICPDESELDKASADLSKALTVYESVYMEIGMKAGARLLYQLLLTYDDPCESTIQ